VLPNILKTFLGFGGSSIYYYYHLDKLTNRMSQLQVKQVKDKAKTKQNDQTTKQSLGSNRTIPTHPTQLASYHPIAGL
jgi:hypothetical protein